MLNLTHCVVDLERRVVRRPEPVALTCREADLLRYLAARPGQVVPRDEALREVFGYHEQVLSRAVDGVVRRLRVKIEADPDHPVHLITEFGVGYRLELAAVPAVDSPVPAARTVLRLAGGEVDLASGRVRRHDGEEASLVGYELTMLRELVRTAGPTVDPRALERRVWGSVLDRSNRLRSLVWRLRSRIEPNPDAPVHLLSVRGHGYRMVLPEAPAESEPSARGTVVAVRVAPDPTGERTEALWVAVEALAAQLGGAAGNFAWGQACVVFADPACAVRAVDALGAVPGACVAVATGEVRRVGGIGACAFVGRAVARATRQAARRAEGALAAPGPGPSVRSAVAR